MILHTDIPVVGWHFDSLNESVLRVEAYASHACGLEVVAEVVVELIAVAVALDDFVFAVCLIEFAVLDELALISAEAHGAAHIGATRSNICSGQTNRSPFWISCPIFCPANSVCGIGNVFIK